MANREKLSQQEIRRAIEEARKDAHRRVDERKESVDRVIERSDKVQEKLRRAVAI